MVDNLTTYSHTAFVLRPTQDEGFSFFSGMLRLQHLLRFAI